MNENTRTFKSIRNIVYGISTQLISTLIHFLSRTIFIKVLNADFLGINGLFSNILSVLSLAELGFGQAIIFSLYKPLAEGDNKKISSLMNFYKKIYDIIAIVVFVIGISLIPFLSFLVKSDISMEYIQQFYLLFLINSVISYLFSYKIAILSADQKQYIQNKHNLLFLCIQFLFQTIILLLTKNYILYLVTQIVINLINNICLSIKVSKMYSYLDKNSELDKIEKKAIYSNVISLFLYKISGVLLNNTDNILISTIVNTVSVGYYSNYLMIINAINSFMTTIFYSTTGSIGNLNTEASTEKKCELYEFMVSFAGFIYGACALVLVFVFNDFIELWLGPKYILDISIVYVIAINFFMPGLLIPSWIYRDTTGIFNKTRYLALITAAINIVLSIILGIKFGIFGILLATAISRLLTNFWYEPYVLYKYIFKNSLKRYMKKLLIFIVIYAISFIITNALIKNIVTISLINIIIKSIVSLLVTTILFAICFIREKEMQTIKSLIKMIASKAKN